jgi:protein O-GlcNAc transferase
MLAVDGMLRAAEADWRRGDLAGARRHVERALEQAPALVPALRLHATVLMQCGATREAVAVLGRVLELEPADVESMANLASLHGRDGNPAAAVVILERAIALQPSLAALHYNLGNALMRLGRIDEALLRFDATLRLAPELALAHNNRGSALKHLGRPTEACAAFERAVQLDPRLAAARNNLGIALAARGDWPGALVQLEEAVRLDPGSLEARGELASALVEAGQLQRAFDEFERALALAPDNENLWYNLGTALMRAGDIGRAIDLLEALARRRPGDAELLINLAQLMLLAARPREAIGCLERAQAVRPDAPRALPLLAVAKLQLCDWQGLEPVVAGLARVAYSAADDVPPLALSLVVDSPQAQHAAARSYASYLDRGQVRATRRPLSRRPGRIRLAYVSPDFGEHPVAHSVVEVLERHDRARFEVIGVAVAPRGESPVGRRIAAACEQFIDASGQSDGQVAALLAQLDVDVAVDLAGYTMGSRPRIFAARGARVQAGYLGYPGTMGSAWLDYLIADRGVVPEDSVADYSERIVWLPECFFPSDSTQAVDPAPPRAAAGLPEQGIVFACMTRPMRILPEVFASWLRILAATPGSVLWLNAAGEAGAMLRSEAAARGIDAQRLRFAGRLDARPAYLGRLSLADVYLDTFPYAGHSTVRDALWSGVPVVTREGRSFAARVAPSLLRAVGLGDWVACDAADYESLAIAVARDRERIAGAREQLRLRERLPAFDMRRLTADLETAYAVLLERWLRGERPSHLALDRGGADVSGVARSIEQAASA